EPKNLPNACELAKSHSTAAVTSAANGAVLESERQPNARLRSASFDRLAFQPELSKKDSRPSTFAPGSVGVCSNVVITHVLSFATRALVVAVEKLFSTRSVAIADELFSNLHYLAAPVHLHAGSIARGRRIVVIRKSPTTAM
ncbi:hypothetical protein MMC08_008657, partial [Hypocenomyce scalaris]|nr:hypothetical protein [Hypocenomyce scalaris]